MSGEESAGGARGRPALDPSKLERLREVEAASGRTGLVKRLATLFLERAPDRIGAMRRAAAAGDIDALQSAAHALVGIAGNVGADRLGELARDLQRADLTEAPARLAALETEWERVRVAMEALATD